MGCIIFSEPDNHISPKYVDTPCGIVEYKDWINDNGRSGLSYSTPYELNSYIKRCKKRGSAFIYSISQEKMTYT